MTRATPLHRQVAFGIALIAGFFLSLLIISSLSILKDTVSPETYLSRIALALDGFLLVILAGWFSYRLTWGIIFSIAASIFVLLASVTAHLPVFIWFIVQYAVLGYLIFRMVDNCENQIAAFEVDKEKYQNEKNALEVSYRSKGEGISIFFEKYSTYYHLRKTAEELSTTLSVSQVCQMVVARAGDFITAGDAVLVTLATIPGEASSLSVVAWKADKNYEKFIRKEGDLFDEWVVRHNKRLIVSDAHQDFRFDSHLTMKQTLVRSIIAIPLLHGGRVMGTLRVNSARAETFTNDELRLLDAIGALASSAISNAKLYEKTEELAIRDSLTGLYLRRHFYERLKHEHRRALLNKRPLAFLMCDLDHFKACNDRFGHGAGDLMLIRFAEVMRESTENAILARYGGEEFAVLLPDSSKADALAAAERIRARVEQAEFMLRREKIQMTVSIGVAVMPEDTLDLEALVEKADQALYKAKGAGRNRVCSNDH